MTTEITRRRLIASLGAAAGVAIVAPKPLFGQATQQRPLSAPTVVSNPPRDFGPGAPPTTYFADPDVLTIDPAFGGLVQANAAIVRLWTGALWMEGPAWNSQGRYLLWSDIPANRQYRWLEDDGHVSVFRQPSNNSNGNTFDRQGRQISCEHATRRGVRYEHDGSVTVIAGAFQGKRPNSPNDIPGHPHGGGWFTRPPYRAQGHEGGATPTGNRAPPTEGDPVSP